MTRARPILGIVPAVLMVLGWALVFREVYLIALRELYHAGERVGITSSAARLAGQIKGFTYREAPAWYSELALWLAVVVWIGPGLIAGLALHRRWATADRVAWASAGARVMRPALAVALGSVVVSLGLGHGAVPVWEAILHVFEHLGARATYVGVVGTGANGPFGGERWIDSAGNFTLRHGPQALFVMMGTLAALFAHAWLWRGDDRRARSRRLCAACGYDLAALPAAAVCPECGASTEPRR